MFGDRNMRLKVCAWDPGGELEGWVWHPSYAQGLCGAAREACPEALGSAHKHRKHEEAPGGTGEAPREAPGGQV